MSSKERAVRELAAVLHVLGHAQRVRIIEELRDGEHDVNFLAEAIGCSHARVSQHLAKLRGLRLVRMRREGRHVFYRLANPTLASWLLDGLDFVESEFAETEQIRDSVREARESWRAPDSPNG
ncbi:MAG: helix-turn-helix transcriptional regulator [Myxococcales bacterium]|nr:helix-turn-helix transcriptional regulator [Myxococcales bacterium]